MSFCLKIDYLYRDDDLLLLPFTISACFFRRNEMRRLLLPAFVVGLFLSLLSSAHAHRGDRLYPIFELTDADLALVDLHDGSVGDWESLFGEAAITALDFRASPNFGPYDPASIDFRIWLAWHGASNRIYVAMERTDDIYINEYNPQRRGGYYRFMEASDSSLLFAVDGDHSGGRYSGFSGREDLDLILQSLDRGAQQYVGIIASDLEN